MSKPVVKKPKKKSKIELKKEFWETMGIIGHPEVMHLIDKDYVIKMAIEAGIDPKDLFILQEVPLPPIQPAPNWEGVNYFVGVVVGMGVMYMINYLIGT